MRNRCDIFNNVQDPYMDIFKICQNGTVEQFEEFLKGNRKFDMESRDPEGYTLLMTASYGDNIEMVKKLLTYPNINKYAVDDQGDNAMIWAILNTNLEMVKLFVQHDVVLPWQRVKTMLEKHVDSGITDRDVVCKYLITYFKLSQIA